MRPDRGWGTRTGLADSAVCADGWGHTGVKIRCAASANFDHPYPVNRPDRGNPPGGARKSQTKPRSSGTLLQPEVVRSGAAVRRAVGVPVGARFEGGTRLGRRTADLGDD